MNSILQIGEKKWEAGFAMLEVDDNNIIYVAGKEGIDVTKEDFELLDGWMDKFKP